MTSRETRLSVCRKEILWRKSKNLSVNILTSKEIFLTKIIFYLAKEFLKEF